ncbi:glutathione peroxidase [Enterovirga aerilata]|uniref:Glutathione peroxidase n=1 Tax=Enterovirga aerilata TaxID=2730920 RepID=A0A849IAF1_9HYPH|nr:glutathione peroxidase [Enterovirga sp. DB1703]NNM73389.1 glutathione peroxidase [Enterovirga sp. DB1703]
MPSIYDFEVTGARGEVVPLDRYRDRVLLVVNTASFCAYTPQYAELVELHKALGPLGLSVLAFPCNQFGAQEPGSAEEISTFCRVAYDVTFPVFARVDVNGPNAHPLYAFLTSARRGIFGTRSIKWNFTKFLADRDGQVVARFAPRIRPRALEPAIRKLLGPEAAL